MTTTNAYLLPIRETLKSSWQRVKGTKTSVWIAYGIIFLISIGMSLFDNLMPDIFPELHSLQESTAHQIDHLTLGIVLYIILSLFFILFAILLRFGILLIGIEQAKDKPITFNLMFRSLKFRTARRLLAFLLLQIILLLGPFFATILLAFNIDSFIRAILVFAVYPIILIYLCVRLFLTYGFILDKEATIWQAMQSSFRATRDSFWRLIFIYSLLMLVFFISIIPLGVGLIWSIPLYIMAYGTIYKNLTLIAAP